MAKTHEPKVRRVTAGADRWRPICSCGYVGNDKTIGTKRQASDRARQHVARANARLRKVEGGTYQGRQYGTTNTLSRYEVSVGGEVIGHVFQARSDTRQTYAGQMYGYDTTRTTWSWESVDLGGDYEFDSRQDALDGLLEFHHQVTKEN